MVNINFGQIHLSRDLLAISTESKQYSRILVSPAAADEDDDSPTSTVFFR